ncbi:MAG: tyrosine-type recombinase/integrase, partial [Oscillospiraceae bacterium]
QQRKPIPNGAPDLIFRYPDGRPIQEHWLNQRLRNLTNQLALPPITFHSLRHSSISYKLVLTSGNIKAVQRDAGHAQAAMVTEVYGHIWDENRRENAQRFEAQFYGDGGTGK